jgi:hypothetical protein
LLGLLILPMIWTGFALLLQALLPSITSTTIAILLIAEAVIAGFISWIIVRRASARVAAVFATLALLAYVLLLLIAIPSYQAYKPSYPQAEAPGPGIGGSADSEEKAQLPEFPWPPPTASASYVLPDAMLEGYQTVGEAAAAILSALERNGYVERSFFRTEADGIALVTRLERINEDGSSFAENERWPGNGQRYESTESLFRFLQGLFYVDPGHYRVIVFILQDLPFSQSSENITAEEAKAWLTSGANVLPPEIAEQPFGNAHCTVLIYEFASDGKNVHVVESHLTGKGHLEKAGLLAALDHVQ